MHEAPDPGDLATWPQSIARVVRAASLRNQVVVNAKDGSVLVRVPGGRFEMGDGRDGNCSKHEVELSEYWIGVYCVAEGQYARFVKETGHGGGAYSAPGREEHHPAVHANWQDAQAYCEWADGDLPTEAQWEKAARGPLGLIYPWGNEWDGAKCRTSNNRGDEETTLVWGHAAGASGYGTYQQSGNVWEWRRDWYDGSCYERLSWLNPAGPEQGSYRVNRGGSWRKDAPASYQAALRNRFDPANCGGLGFRLVRTV